MSLGNSVLNKIKLKPKTEKIPLAARKNIARAFVICAPLLSITSANEDLVFVIWHVQRLDSLQLLLFAVEIYLTQGI
jgi:hypothetical protein